MRSAFFGLHIASSAMNAARGSLNTVAHNVANVQTPGFSRQVAVQQASTPLRVGMGRGMVGTGSQIVSITQIRNHFLDAKFRNQNAVLGQFTAKAENLALTQGIMRAGPTQHGLSAEMDDLFSRLSDLGTNAGDQTYRRNVLSSFESVSTFLSSTFSQLTRQMVDINQEIRTTVGIVNSLGRQITSLNRQITLMELDGSNANDLRDQRNLLLDQLSRYVNIEVREFERNPEFAAGRTSDPRDSRRELTVLIDGHPFISHFHMHELEVRQRTAGEGNHVLLNPEEPPRMYDIFWSTGSRFNMYSSTLSGELAGLIHLRDGNGGNISRVADFTRDITGALPHNVLVIDAFGPHSRMDIGASGVITARGPAGQLVQIRYTGREFIPPGVFPPEGARLILHEADIPGDFGDGTGWNLTIAETSTYMGIPYFKDRLNQLARTLARAFNEGRHLISGEEIVGLAGGHFDGYDAEGNRGGILFTYRNIQTGLLNMWDGDWDTGGFNYFNITANNFIINPDILGNVDLFALAGDPSDLQDGHSVVMGWLNLSENRSLFREGRLGDFLSSITGDLGVTVRQAVSFAESYNDLINTIENQRKAISGICLEEEGVSMIMHQLVFNAAARLLTIIDSIYDTTINRMGNW